MPELPEVETTRLGVEPHIKNQTILTTEIRQPRLRWPIPAELPEILSGKKVERVDRRGKYLLVKFPHGVLIIHLGMSGSLRITDLKTPLRKHDHFILSFSSQIQLRLHDPRRFGAVLWWHDHPATHPLLSALGPEPLSKNFTRDYLFASCRNRKVSIKQHIMNSKTVVGVGNIYASEALFLSGIHPKRQAGRISVQRCQTLTRAIKQVLQDAIEQGGTTLRDFVRENGEPGYFKQHLNVYGRIGEPCYQCQSPIKQITLGQRSTFYCTKCQH